ncbi:MAG: hypothetical protein LBR15_06845 [Methanobrevibacter sp.]|jgi:hypothetical protein|nr:hypothetical protein [Candidatus Methanovirga australis]
MKNREIIISAMILISISAINSVSAISDNGDGTGNLTFTSSDLKWFDDIYVTATAYYKNSDPVEVVKNLKIDTTNNIHHKSVVNFQKIDDLDHVDLTFDFSQYKMMPIFLDHTHRFFNKNTKLGDGIIGYDAYTKYKLADFNDPFVSELSGKELRNVNSQESKNVNFQTLNEIKSLSFSSSDDRIELDYDIFVTITAKYKNNSNPTVLINNLKIDTEFPIVDNEVFTSTFTFFNDNIDYVDVSFNLFDCDSEKFVTNQVFKLNDGVIGYNACNKDSKLFVREVKA